MKYRVFRAKRFRKNLKKMLRRGKDVNKLNEVVLKLAQGETLPPKYRDHALSGDLDGLRDCHIENDWELLYFYTSTGELVLTLTDTGIAEYRYVFVSSQSHGSIMSLSNN